MAARNRAGPQIDRDGRIRAGIAERVDAGAAVDVVRAGAAHQDVVGGIAIQRVRIGATRERIGFCTAIDQVGAAVTRQDIGMGRACEIGHGRQHVALGVAARAGAGQQVDGDGLRGRAVIGCIDAAAAHQGVRAETARQRVGRRPAVEQVDIAVAGDPVGQCRSGDVGHARQHVARRSSTEPGTGRKVDRDRQQRRGVVGHVGATAAQEGVVPQTADERVGAGAAVQDVAVVIAGQQVGTARRADQVGDGLQHVALCVTA